MKKISAAVVLLGLSLCVPAAYADTPLQSTGEVNGSWKLDHTKKNAASEENLKREDTWNFNDGKVTILHIPRDGVFYDQPPVDYEVEGGKLKISILGRPGKYDVYSLVEKNDKNMTLKGKYGDLYFFNKK